MNLFKKKNAKKGQIITLYTGLVLKKNVDVVESHNRDLIIQQESRRVRYTPFQVFTIATITRKKATLLFIHLFHLQDIT